MRSVATASEALRAEIDILLDENASLPILPEVISKTASLIALTYQHATDEEWDDVATRFCRKFNLDREQAARQLGLVEKSAPAPITTIERKSIEEVINEGWFHKYLDYTAESEAPASFHVGSALACVAAGLGRRPLIEWEARDTYPNLYVLLVGPTGARKGSAINLATATTRLAMEINVLPTEGTHQGFAHHLRLRYNSASKWSDGLIVAPEFSVLMKKDRNREKLVQWLTDWYDSPDYWARALQGDEQYELHNVCVSMLGGSNMAWLRTMPEDAITGGFMPRFLVMDGDNRRHRKARPKFNSKLQLELVQQLTKATQDVPSVIGFDSAAERYMDNWYENELAVEYDKTSSEQFRAWLDRKQAAVLKTAVVWQIADGGPKDKVQREWLDKARQLADWCDVGVKRVYNQLGVTPEGEAAEFLATLLARNGGRLSQRDIVRAARNRYRAATVRQALETLKLGGDVEKVGNAVEGVIWVLQ